MLERIVERLSIYFISILRLTQSPLSTLGRPLTGRIEMKQLDIFDTDYESCNYTETSKQALADIKPKIKTKRQQVHELIKLKPLNNCEISRELEIPLSSVCARVRELQLLDLIEDSGYKRKTVNGKNGIVWQVKKKKNIWL